jgi:hypothetical protein
MSEEMRSYMFLVETLITNARVLNVEMSPYEFSTLMKEYRATDPTYNKIGDNAMVAFYSEEEREDFKKFLKANKVGFTEIDDEYKDGLP